MRSTLGPTTTVFAEVTRPGGMAEEAIAAFGSFQVAPLLPLKVAAMVAG